MPFLCGIRILLNSTEMGDDEDEIVVSLAEVLGSFTDFVGGTAHALILVKPLEPLASAEEAVVRDKVTPCQQL